MRYFNTHGPVDEAKHYIVSRSELIASLMAQIEEGRYFTIFAPRQMGKTTLLRRVRNLLQTRTGYIAVMLSFQLFENWSVEDFWPEFGRLLMRQIIASAQTTTPTQVENLKSIGALHLPTTTQGFWHFFDELHQIAPELKIVLIIDEFDAIPQEAISPLLQTWREIYLTMDPPRSLHSVLLVGLQNIATLNLGRSSPFNIARQLRLADFSLEQVRELLTQYTAESGQEFTPPVVEKLYLQTGGHPFLANRLAAILTEEIAVDRTQPITLAHFDQAQDRLVRETNYNFETLARHARDQHDWILDILFGKPYAFNLNDPLVRELYMEGIIKGDAAGDCQIANPIYRQVLAVYLRPRELLYQRDILMNGHDFRTYATPNELQMTTILSRFREFVERRRREAFKVSPMPQEIVGQYLLMAYLEAIVRQTGGAAFTEAPSGDGYLDLIVVYAKQRYIIETKIWRGQVKFDQGLTQLESYLDKEGQQTGYYVVFHARPSVYGELTYAELEFTLNRPSGKHIHVYLVRLGKMLDE